MGNLRIRAKNKIIVGNWKMNPASLEEAKKVFNIIAKFVGLAKKPSVIICPSTLHFQALKARADKSAVSLGVQNFSHHTDSASTGEISAAMVSDSGAKYAIIGHSERRALGETDEIINTKMFLALKHNVVPILCIGEHTRDEEGKYFTFIKEQLEKNLTGVSRDQLSNIIIAYEPIWAIGAEAAMRPGDIHEMSIFIRKTLVDLYKIRGKEKIEVPILYGGSVDATNTHDILSEGAADGLLIGRQSLVAESFLEIIKVAQVLSK